MGYGRDEGREGMEAKNKIDLTNLLQLETDRPADRSMCGPTDGLTLRRDGTVGQRPLWTPVQLGNGEQGTGGWRGAEVVGCGDG